MLIREPANPSTGRASAASSRRVGGRIRGKVVLVEYLAILGGFAAAYLIFDFATARRARKRAAIRRVMEG